MISTLGIIYLVVFVIAFYPANIVVDKGGLRVTVFAGMGLTTLGAMIKCLVNYSFMWVIVG